MNKWKVINDFLYYGIINEIEFYSKFPTILSQERLTELENVINIYNENCLEEPSEYLIKQFIRLEKIVLEGDN